MIRNKQRHNGFRIVTLFAISAAVIVLAVTIVTIRNAGKQALQKATVANTTSLDSVLFPDASELLRQKGELPCIRTAWYRIRTCEVYELRMYKISIADDVYTEAMQEALVVHGWANSVDLPAPGGFFYKEQRKGNTAISAAAQRLAYADNGQGPVQTSLNLLLTTSRTPQLSAGPAINYNDSLTRKINSSLSGSDRLLVVGSRTNYNKF